jgi:NAD(P)-dependent dehydrogenase (short-subunit alcohol dehydrogenase family)
MNRAVLPHMRRQRSGLIIYISSGAGRIVFPFLGFYSASKFALEALAESYHYQLYGLGIDSVIVEPGRYATAVSANSPQPSDPSRRAGYGEIGVQLEQAATDFMASFSAPSCPDPQEVADAVAELVAMPPGARPLRVPIGASASLEPLNQVIAQVQTDILERTGLAWLMKRDAHR